MSGNSKLLFKALISFHSIVAFSFLISCFLHFYFDHIMYQTYSHILYLKEMLHAVRCLKSNEDMILALAGQFKQLSHEPEKFK